MLKLELLLPIIVLYNIKAVYLHCVFHGIRFKVNEDWVSVIDTLLFLYIFDIGYKEEGVSNDAPSYFIPIFISCSQVRLIFIIKLQTAFPWHSNKVVNAYYSRKVQFHSTFQ